MEPVRVDFERGDEVDRWRVIGNLVLGIPQFLVSRALQALGSVLMLIAAFTVLFTEQIPPQIFDLIVMTHRYQWRVSSYALFMRNEYPPFDFTMVGEDPGGDPASLSIERQERYQRWAPLYKWLLAIPHYIVLVVLVIGAVFAIIAAWFAVLFTGKWPRGLRDYIVKLTRYYTRVAAYIVLRDEYPAFGLQ